MNPIPKTFLLIIIALFSLVLFGQNNLNYESIDWDSIPTSKYTIPAKYKNEPQFLISIKQINELIVMESENSIQNFEVYTVHSKLFLNSLDAIEQNNRIVLSYKQGEEVLQDKIRVIKPNGEVVSVEKSDIKEAVNEKTNQNYKYYAVKGLEKGSIIERLTTTKEIPNLSGLFINVQGYVPIQNAEINFIYPKHLEYEFYANQIKEKSKTDTLHEVEKISTQWKLADINAMEDEEMSNVERHRKRIFYKLSANHYNNKFGLNSYQNFVDNFREVINPIPNKNEKKAIEKFLKDLKFGSNLDEKIRQIEDYAKEKIKIDDYTEDATTDKIIQNKIASEVSFTRLLSQIFTLHGIEFQVFLTTDRFDLPFIKEFNSYEFLRELGFYFPKQNAYLAVDKNLRYPFLNENWTENYGLFFTKKTIGGNVIQSAEVKYISVPENLKSGHKMNIVVDFTENINNPKVIFENEQYGYSALGYQSIFDYTDKKSHQNIREGIASSYLPKSIQADNTTIDIQNIGVSEFYKKPFVLKLEYNAQNLIEKVGDKLIFGVGEIIGPQMELYQEKQRKLEVEKDYRIYYDRQIKILLPDDYEIINLDDVNFDVKTSQNSKPTAWFTSNYSKQGNNILINNQEYYTEIFYPVEKYSEFAYVINAAADFNKLKFIIKKK